MKIEKFLWITPFLFFIVGYWFMGKVFAIKTIEVPRVVGLPIHEGIKELSAKKLNVRILAEKEDAELPVGTILRQTPSPLDRVKPNYSIFLVTSKKPPVLTAPDLCNKSLEACIMLLKKDKIKYETFPVNSSLPTNTCVCQTPEAGEPLRTKKITLYVSSPKSSLHIFPNCLQENLVDVVEFCKMYHLSPSIRYAEGQPRYAMHHYVVVEQKPLPGTLVDLSKPCAMQLLAKRQ
ncbi:MAG TPA: PASTA domain-containing protein [Candidatus Babeliales bacterium]|nr:PASTA domain-containing protein [Candidatus Babeliales bacterium]